MDRDPFGDEPISKEERDLKFDFDPSRNYMADVDALQPPWFLPPYQTAREAPGAAMSNETTPRMVGRGRNLKGVPAFLYVRAIDPAGNLVQLTVSTCRPSPEYPGGDDGIGTMARVIAEKSAKGWLIVEPGPQFANPYSGKIGNEYVAWALAVMQLRQKRHAAKEATEAQAFIAKETQRAHEQAAKQTEAMQNMGVVIGREVAKAVLEAKDTKRGKGDTP
ncbi:MAG TPA: hypothetical protein VEJ18_20285 [Planctomycetota bacterium]|nr:hypothetical protein [Planctomycetota bacterium]